MKHHQTLRRGLGALLSLLLCLTLLPAAALAAEGEDSTAESYGLWIGNDAITSKNADSIFEDGGNPVVRYSLTEPGNPKGGGTLYIETNVWFAEDYTEDGTSATIYAKYPLTIRLNAGLTVSTYDQSDISTAVGSGNIYCEDALTVQGSSATVNNQNYDLFVLGSVSAKSVTLKYAHLTSNAGSVTAREGNITLTGSCLQAHHGTFTDGTCVSAAKGAIIAKNAETRNSTECYKNGEKQDGFVSGETNCLKNTNFVAELDNRPEQVETPAITPYPYYNEDGIKFVGTQEVYIFCNTNGAEIYYTLDNSTPTRNSERYTGPIIIDENCVVTAIAVKEGMADSEVRTDARFTRVTGLDEPSIRFSPDGKAYAAWNSEPSIPFTESYNGYDYVVVSGSRAEDDFDTANIKGKVAVVQLGGNVDLKTKYENAKKAGAKGFIICNDTPGTLSVKLSQDLQEATDNIPVISTTLEAWQAAQESPSGTLWIDQQRPGFKAKICNVRYLTGERDLLTGRVKFTALCGEGDSVKMDAGVVLAHKDGVVPSTYSEELEKFDHWSCNDPNVSLTVGTGFDTFYDRLITFPDHDIQLIANWKDAALPAPHYKITFDLNYEGAPNAAEAVTGTDGKLAALLHDPVRSGYLFEGWYTAANGGEEVTVDRVYDAPTTLHAHWAVDDGSIAISARNFPDAAFRAFISEKCDTDKNGRLSTAERETVTTVECRNLGITDLTGIAYFTALEELNCTGNRLTELDVSRNTALKKLYCFKNRLAALDVSRNTELNTLNCSNNQLTSLNLSHNTKLTDLDTEGNAHEIQPSVDRTFDLSTLPGFDVNKASDWTGGTVSGNTLTVDENAALVTYNYQMGNQRTSEFAMLINGVGTAIDINETNFPDAAFRVYLSDPDSNIDRNRDGVLSAGEIALVREIDVYDESDIKSLEGIEYFTALTDLDCHGCNLTSLDLSKNTELTDLSAKDNTYEIEPDADGTFALSSLPGKFDVSKTSNWQGGSVDKTTGILTVNKDAEEVTYDYDCGNNQEVNFTLKIAKKYTVTAYDLYGSRPGFTPGKTYTGSYAAGDTVNLPIGTREGYTFGGLKCEEIAEKDLTIGNDMGEPIVFFTMPANDVTITVNWVKNGSSFGSGSSGSSTYPVTFTGKIENGSVTVSPKNAGKGDTVTITVTPDEGYTLEALTVTDRNGNELKLTGKGNGKYTFTQPSGKVTVTATFMDDNTMLNYFADVTAGDYFYDAVLWAAQKGITSGTDAAHFSPYAPCTRAQIVTFLWRAAGSPVVNYAMNMSDVPEDAYYAEAVRWALSQGITTGTSDTAFSPDAPCTRAQAVAFLYRAAGSPAVSDGNAFSDVAANAYYADAVTWAEKNGVTGGIGGGLFGSGRDCTRAQIVTFLYRAYQGK